jgi:protein SCO1/2
MLKKYTILSFLLIVLVLPFTVFGVVKWIENRFQKLPVYEYIGPTLNFNLKNQYGEIVDQKHWEDKIIIADFFFTHCPVVCPKMKKNLLRVEAAFRKDADIKINSFSVDPERDSVAQLKKFADKIGISGNWNLLTGDKIDIYRLARNSFRIVATDGDGGESDFIHSEKFVLLDKQKRIRGYYTGTDEEEVNKLIKDIKKLKHEN